MDLVASSLSVPFIVHCAVRCRVVVSGAAREACACQNADTGGCTQVREQGGYIEVLVDVNAKAEFEKKYWKGILDAQGKADGGYY